MAREIGLGSLLILVTALARWALGVRPGAGILGKPVGVAPGLRRWP